MKLKCIASKAVARCLPIRDPLTPVCASSAPRTGNTLPRSNAREAFQHLHHLALELRPSAASAHERAHKRTSPPRPGTPIFASCARCFSRRPSSAGSTAPASNFASSRANAAPSCAASCGVSRPPALPTSVALPRRQTACARPGAGGTHWVHRSRTRASCRFTSARRAIHSRFSASCCSRRICAHQHVRDGQARAHTAASSPTNAASAPSAASRGRTSWKPSVPAASICSVSTATGAIGGGGVGSGLVAGANAGDERRRASSSDTVADGAASASGGRGRSPASGGGGSASARAAWNAALPCRRASRLWRLAPAGSSAWGARGHHDEIQRDGSSTHIQIVRCSHGTGA
jgi:hypothetical protein